jgi:hypothetical protein
MIIAIAIVWVKFALSSGFFMVKEKKSHSHSHRKKEDDTHVV